MKFSRFELFMSAYCMSVIATVAFMVLLMLMPWWAWVPATIALVATMIMLMEYHRLAILDRAWRPTPPRSQA